MNEKKLATLEALLGSLLTECYCLAENYSGSRQSVLGHINDVFESFNFSTGIYLGSDRQFLVLSTGTEKIVVWFKGDEVKPISREETLWLMTVAEVIATDSFDSVLVSEMERLRNIADCSREAFTKVKAYLLQSNGCYLPM